MNEQNFESMSMGEMMGQIDTSMRKIKNGEIIKGKVISVTDDEVMVNIGHISDGIIPKGEVSSDLDANLKELFKQDDEVYVYVLKVNDGEGNVLLSKKRADSYKVWDEFEECYKNGNTLEVKIDEVVKGGVISYIKGVRAFIPASQLSTEYVNDLGEFKGKTLTVKIIEFDKNDKKIILSRKEIEREENNKKELDLWESIARGEKYHINDIANGSVKKLMNFGAFVELEKGIEGLVHISEIREERVTKVSDELSVGDKVQVKILDINAEDHRISLSIKEALEKPKEDYSKYNDAAESNVTLADIFGDKLKNLKLK